MMRALTSQLQGLYGERRGAREVFEQWRTRSELGACFWVPDGNMIKAGSRSGQFYGIELTGFVLRAAAGGGKGGRGEELDPGQRDGLQGPVEEVKMVLVRQLGRSSQTDVQGQTGHVGTGIFRQRDWKGETGRSAEPARWGRGPSGLSRVGCW